MLQWEARGAHCEEGFLKLVTTGLSLKGKISAIKMKMGHVHMHSHRDDSVTVSKIRGPTQSQAEPAGVQALDSVLHTLQTDQISRPDLSHPDVPGGYFSFWRSPNHSTD